MQSPASDRARAPDHYVVRLSAALATLLGRAEGAELPEDELLGRLRECGLITYPSPLLVPLLEEWPEVLAAEVLPRLDPTDLALFARVGPASRAVVVACGLLGDVYMRRFERPSADAAVASGARLPVERGDMRYGSW